MHTLAAVCRTTGGQFTLETLKIDEPRVNEILIKVVGTGICHTDLGMRDSPDRVPKPIVLGHEGAGIVVKTGKHVTKVKPGDHVVMTFNSCGHCASCYQSDATYCAELVRRNFSGQREDGTTALSDGQAPVHSHFFAQSAFSTYAICSERNAVAVRQDIPIERLGPLGCGIQTGAGAVINSLQVPPGSSIGIFGTGSVGLAAVIASKISGAGTIIAVDTNSNRLEVARALGATHTINPLEDDLFTSIKNTLPGGLNFALDTSGNLDIIHDAIAHLSPRGVCGLINTAKGADLRANIFQMVVGGRSIKGIHQGDSIPEIFIPQMIDMYVQGKFPFDKLITYYELADINNAIADMERGKTIKPVILMPQSVTTA